MSVEKKILAAFGSALLVLVVAAVTYSHIRDVRADQSLVSHTNEVIETLLGIESDTRSAESRQRGYLITGDEADARSYREAVGAVTHGLDRLRALAIDSPERTSRARDLAARVHARFARLDAAMRARDVDGRDAAERLVTDGQGQEIMDGLLARADAMIDSERSLLAKRRVVVERALSRTAIIVGTGSLIAFALAIAVNVGIRGELVERARRAAELQETLAQRNRALSELEATNRDLDQFAYIASHDLKAPLRGIANLSEWVEEDLGAAMTEGSREHLNKLRGRVHRMEALIDGVLAYSRAGRSAEKTEVVAVGVLVREIVEILAAPEGKVAFRISDDLPTLRTERVPLQQVLMNLIGNAVKHGRGDGAEIRVEGRPADDGWELSVLDNGPGVPAEYRSRIFGIFQRLEARDKVEGAGIGLAIVQKLVTRRGGRVWVEATPSGGAAFHFTWPSRAANREPPVDLQAAAIVATEKT